MAVNVSQLLTGVIIISSSLLLGSFFNHWLIDYSSIWVNPSTLSEESIRAALIYYHSFFPGTAWYTAYLTTLAVAAIAATVAKIALNMLSGMLFDGASLMLLLSAFAMYLTNVQAALEFLPLGEPVKHHFSTDARVREALQSLAASNMIIAVSLTGVLYLQAAQGYSEKKVPYISVTPAPSAPASPAPASPTKKAAPSANKKKA